MDADTRAVAERLRDGLTARDVDLPDGCIGDDDGEPCVTMGGLWWGRDDGALWPFSDRDGARVLPDLSAPATWGVLLGLLAEADPVDLVSIVDAVACDARHGQPVDFGAPLARALLAAWGTP